MAKRTDDSPQTAATPAAPWLPRMLTLEQVQEILNVKSSLVYALVRSGELPAGQFGGRGAWRVRESDLAAYIESAFAKTAERIAAGQIPEDQVSDND